jgi:hypothetical protein
MNTSRSAYATASIDQNLVETGRCISALKAHAPGIYETFPIELKNFDFDVLYVYPTTKEVFTGRFLVGPLRMRGSTLPFGGSVWLDFVDSTGLHLITLSVQTVLYLIDDFVKHDQVSLLAQAALYYGLDAHALMGAELDSMVRWDVCDASGRVLQAGLTHYAAHDASEEYGRMGVEEIRIKRAAVDVHGDPRHEGRLVLLHHNLGVTTFTGIAVKSHAGRCGMMLEEALWRFDQFSEKDQATLLAGLAKHFDLVQPQRETAGAA